MLFSGSTGPVCGLSLLNRHHHHHPQCKLNVCSVKNRALPSAVLEAKTRTISHMSWHVFVCFIKIKYMCSKWTISVNFFIHSFDQSLLSASSGRALCSVLGRQAKRELLCLLILIF